jgi:hypothetical protein
VVVAVAEKYETAGEDVVREHLCIILPLLLDINDHDLLHVKGPLHEIVKLVQSRCLAEGPPFPQPVEIEPKLGVVHEILSVWLALRSSTVVFEQRVSPYSPFPETTSTCNTLPAMPAP